jgi:hypothetical protein
VFGSGLGTGDFLPAFCIVKRQLLLDIATFGLMTLSLSLQFSNGQSDQKRPEIGR